MLFCLSEFCWHIELSSSLQRAVLLNNCCVEFVVRWNRSFGVFVTQGRNNSGSDCVHSDWLDPCSADTCRFLGFWWQLSAQFVNWSTTPVISPALHIRA